VSYCWSQEKLIVCALKVGGRGTHYCNTASHLTLSSKTVCVDFDKTLVLDSMMVFSYDVQIKRHFIIQNQRIAFHLVVICVLIISEF